MLSFTPTILVVALLLPTTVSPFSMPHGSAINVGGIHHSSYFNNIHHSTTISSTTTQLNVLRRPLLSEDDLAKPPDSKIINAVESIRGGKVIASDVAAKAGVSLSEAKTSLSSLATLTQGDIAVTPDGDLVYSFPENVKAALASNSARYKSLQVLEKAWPKIFYGIRVSFGAAIFVSIAAIFSTIFFISAAGGSDRDDRRDDRRGGGMGGFGTRMMFEMVNPFNYFGYRPYYGYYGSYNPYSPRSFRTLAPDGAPPPRRGEEEEQPNAFERIFSYIFGSGNPNRGLDAARLRSAAAVIRANGGAVTAEQLAPFLDVPDPPSSVINGVGDDVYVDESYVLPIVSRLGGEPVVTDEGDIVYVFSDLQVSAESTLGAAGLEIDATAGEIKKVLGLNGVDARGALERRDLIQLLEKTLVSLEDKGSSSSSSMTRMREKFGVREMMEQGERNDEDDRSNVLIEETLEFNRNGQGWNFLAGGLGVVNFGGAIYLGQLLSSPALVGVRLPAWFGLVQSSFPLLVGYAILYNVIPAARYLYNKNANEGIEQRNRSRKRWRDVLGNGGSRMRRKLTAARELRKGVKRLDGKSSVYDTSNDIVVLEASKEKESMMDFDRMLEDEDNTFQ